MEAPEEVVRGEGEEVMILEEEEVLLEGVRTVLSTWPADDVFGGTVLNFS